MTINGFYACKGAHSCIHIHFHAHRHMYTLIFVSSISCEEIYYSHKCLIKMSLLNEVELFELSHEEKDRKLCCMTL